MENGRVIETICHLSRLMKYSEVNVYRMTVTCCKLDNRAIDNLNLVGASERSSKCLFYLSSLE